MVAFDLVPSPRAFRVHCTDHNGVTYVLDDHALYESGGGLCKASRAVQAQCPPDGVDIIGYFWLNQKQAATALRIAKRAAK